MAGQVDQIRFSRETISLLGQIERSVYQHTMNKAVKRAAEQGRTVVTEADVLAGLRSALNEAAEEQLQDAHAAPIPA